MERKLLLIARHMHKHMIFFLSKNSTVLCTGTLVPHRSLHRTLNVTVASGSRADPRRKEQGPIRERSRGPAQESMAPDAADYHYFLSYHHAILPDDAQHPRLVYIRHFSGILLAHTVETLQNMQKC